MNLSSITFPKEPAMYVTLINAIVLVAANFGLPITPDQKLAVDGVVAPLLLVVGGIVIRQNVTPTASSTLAQQIDALKAQRDDLNKLLTQIAAESSPTPPP